MPEGWEDAVRTHQRTDCPAAHADEFRRAGIAGQGGEAAEAELTAVESSAHDELAVEHRILELQIIDHAFIPRARVRP